jgi:DNA-directed RNA polymerase specialized sigma24 family protein
MKQAWQRCKRDRRALYLLMEVLDRGVTATELAKRHNVSVGHIQSLLRRARRIIEVK